MDLTARYSVVILDMGNGCQKECSCIMAVCSHVSGCSEYNLDGTNLNYDKEMKEKH